MVRDHKEFMKSEVGKMIRREKSKQLIGHNYVANLIAAMPCT